MKFTKLSIALLVLLASQSVFARTAPATVAPITIGEALTISSKALGEQRRINIYLPPAYATETARRFPVLYLIDGGLDQDFMHVVGSSHLGAIWARSQAVIVVGIETKDRRKELTGPTADPELLKKYPTAGKSAALRTFIRNEVKPLIAARYRTSGTDAVIGESLAGLFIVETWLREPTLFGSYAAISPSMWWDKERLSQEAAELIAGRKAATPRLYLNIANEGVEMQAGMDRFVTALRTRTGWCYAPERGLTHATIYHATTPEALQFLFPTPVAQDPESGFTLTCSKKS